jgi:hypothetical protein
MGVVSSAGRLLGAFSFLAVLGLVVVVVGVPALALAVGLVALVVGLVVGLVAAALPFALVGLAVWGACLAADNRPRVAWRDLGLRVLRLGRRLVTVPVIALVGLGAFGARLANVLAAMALPVLLRAGEASSDGLALARRGANAAGAILVKARSAGRYGGVLLEAGAGAAVGATLLGLANLGERGPALGVPVVCGAAAGALIGLVVGAARPSLARENSFRISSRS